MSHFYNPDIPLETALDMFDDPHIRYEIIEDYYQAGLRERLGEVALAPTEEEA